MMDIKTDYSDIKFKDNGKLKLLNAANILTAY